MNHARHKAFAFEKLLQGRGYWWVVHELGRTGSVSDEEAHAIVTEVWPEAIKVSLRRNWRCVWMGLFLVFPGCLILMLGYVPLLVIPAAGLSLFAYGVSGLRRYARTGQNPGAEPSSR